MFIVQKQAKNLSGPNSMSKISLSDRLSFFTQEVLNKMCLFKWDLIIIFHYYTYSDED